MDDYYDLGSFTRTVTTSSPEAQIWFDRGLNWTYAYNFEAAVDCFQRAAAIDPTCVMAHWGIGYGVGCNYNKQWRVFSPKEIGRTMKTAREAIQAGSQHLDAATEVEGALLLALEKRFQADGIHEEETLVAWNDDFADAMRLVYQAHPDDHDVATLFAEALINRTPWQLWDLHNNRPAEHASTEEAIAVLERAIDQLEAAGSPPHPGLYHIYIHVMEMSPYPEKALRAADILRELIRDAGHLRHMPSHIDILCGHYYDAVIANNRAIVANNKFLARDGEMNEYTFYRAHDIHFKIYAAMLLGQYQTALEGAEQMRELAHDAILRVERPPMAYSLEGMVSMKLHVLIRFGKWAEILEEPFPEDRELYCNTTAMLHYARGIAAATLGDFETAEAERAAFQVAKGNLHEHRYIFNNTCADILEVAQAMLDGEVEYHKGNYEAAFENLRLAVYRDDHLAYAEPWGWMMPTRHPLAALLLEQGHAAEAEGIYRADLGLDNTIPRPQQHVDNVWSLHGYVTCLEQLGKQDEAAAMRARLNLALARTDVPITASCFCATKSCCH
ncbi:MAG: hypothetical protein H6651_09100 [Ardenticatenales bacterium]|nr:hypothetical protein [Ardenticatenales bacterium]